MRSPTGRGIGNVSGIATPVGIAEHAIIMATQLAWLLDMHGMHDMYTNHHRLPSLTHWLCTITACVWRHHAWRRHTHTSCPSHIVAGCYSAACSRRTNCSVLLLHLILPGCSHTASATALLLPRLTAIHHLLLPRRSHTAAATALLLPRLTPQKKTFYHR
jgi:hypothetical protein